MTPVKETSTVLRTATPPTTTTAVEIVVPVHDEETDLERSVRHLHRYLDERFPHTWVITIADNASTDAPGDRHPLARSSTTCRRCARDQRPAGPPRGRPARPGRRLHGRRPLDRPRRAALSRRCCRATATSPSAPGSPRAAWCGPKRSSSRAPTTCSCARRCAGFSGAVRFQGMRSDVAQRCCRWWRTRLVLRHRAARLAEHNGLRIHEVPSLVDDPSPAPTSSHRRRRPRRGAPPARFAR
jgi:hypothetical protein